MNVKKVLMWFMVLVFVVGFATVGFAETPSKNSELYPTTPEGVVKALVKADFDGSANEVIGDVKKRLKYFIEAYNAGTDGFGIISKYKVIKLKGKGDEVKVKVVFDIIGYIAGYETLKMNKKTEEEIFSLSKEKGLWKIRYPVSEPRISLKTAIKILETEMEKPYYKEHPKLKDKIKKNVTILEKYLKQPEGGRK
jgi:hypothetical protein